MNNWNHKTCYKDPIEYWKDGWERRREGGRKEKGKKKGRKGKRSRLKLLTNPENTKQVTLKSEKMN